MTIQIPDSGPPFDAALVEHQSTMLWLNQTNSRGRRMGRYLLSAVLKIGWRIVQASPEEQTLLEAHGFGSRRIQSGGQMSERPPAPDVQQCPNFGSTAVSPAWVKARTVWFVCRQCEWRWSIADQRKAISNRP